MVSMQYTLTTVDNPYDPFEDFDHWIMFDNDHGYNCCGKLARIARTSDSFTERENDLEVERAIDEIIRYDFLNLYKKVGREIDYEKIYGILDETTEEEQTLLPTS